MCFALVFAKNSEFGYTTVEFLDKNYEVIRRYFNIAMNIKAKREGVSYIDLERDVVEERGKVKGLDHYPEGKLGEIAKKIERKILEGLENGEIREESEKIMKVLKAVFKTLLLSKGVGKAPLNSNQKVLYSYGFGVKEVKAFNSYIMLRKNEKSRIEVLGENLIIPTKIFSLKLPIYLKEENIVSKHIQLIGERLIGFTFFRNCVYFKKNAECLFCEIPTYGGLANKKELEVLKNLGKEKRYFLVITGGFLDFELSKSWEALRSYIEDIDFRNFLQPTLVYHFPKKKWEEAFSLLKGKGVSKLILPMEVPKEFSNIIPGKEFSLSYEERIEEIVEAKKYFGGENVYTNYIYGIVPEDKLRKEILEVMRLGIKVYSTLYHSEGINRIGVINLDVVKTFSFYKWLAENHIKRWGEKPILFDDKSISNHPLNAFVEIAKYNVKPLIYDFLRW